MILDPPHVHHRVQMADKEKTGVGLLSNVNVIWQQSYSSLSTLSRTINLTYNPQLGAFQTNTAS